MSDQYSVGQYSVSSNRWGRLSPEGLREWLDGVARSRTLIAPREVAGVLLYRPVGSSAEVAWDSTRPVMSVKDAFFPPTERLLTIEKNGQQLKLTETLPKGKTAIFGVRPCDARGLKVLDALFIDNEPVDPYYARRRENTTLIGLACKEMGETCFCTSVGGAPDDSRDVDVMLYENEDGYAVEAVTEKGRTLLAENVLRIAYSVSNEKDYTEYGIRNTQHISIPPIESWPTHFNDPFWARMSERCLSCRLCAYVCPTCRCFAVRDEATITPGEFERIRCWDSCAGENYRRIAGGHKPRAEKGERLRNRFFCKFYYYPEQYGLNDTVACTGCGRCVELCPVGVDITEVLGQLAG